MNGKFHSSNSLEGRLAAVALEVIRKVENRINTANQSEKPSVSDFEEAFRIETQIEELNIRLNERDKLVEGHAERRTELVDKLYRLMAQRPKEFQL